MKFVFASDSFKGSLSSMEIAELLKREARACFTDCECVCLPVADGGEGTMEAVLQACGGVSLEAEVLDPLGRRIRAGYAGLDGNRALIEMAAASGLPLLRTQERDPLETTSFGTGEMIRDALERGYRRITIAIGGSATNDGGMGAMRALGIRFLDKDGNELSGKGKDLEMVCRIDDTGLFPLVRQAGFTVMCDVKNPLTGPDGATLTYGAQKGGTQEKLERLERGMKRYEAVLKEAYGQEAGQREGAGAAGGLGAALSVFLQADMKPGIETVLDLVEFDKKLEGASLAVTGEGRLDWQSSFGKVPGGVGERCRLAGVPVIAIVGGMGKGAEEIYGHGISSIVTTINGPMRTEEAMKRAKELYSCAARRVFRLFKAGMEAGTAAAL